MTGILKVAWTFFLYCLSGYALLTLIIFIAQRTLLYLPSEFKPSPEQAREEGLRYWPSFDDYLGFTGANELVNARGTIIVFQGNAGTAYHRYFYIDALSNQGFRVILAEYPGYGGRNGKPSEKILVSDALKTVKLAHQTYGEPIYLWGESLGAGVVAGVVSRTNVPLKGLVMFLPWDSLANLAQSLYWYLPARWLVLDRYDNVKNLTKFSGNVAVLLAEKDEVIPVRLGRNLYKSINSNKKLWLFQTASHNTVPIGPQMAWWREVSDFISQ